MGRLEEVAMAEAFLKRSSSIPAVAFGALSLMSLAICEKLFARWALQSSSIPAGQDFMNGGGGSIIAWSGIVGISAVALILLVLVKSASIRMCLGTVGLAVNLVGLLASGAGALTGSPAVYLAAAILVACFIYLVQRSGKLMRIAVPEGGRGE